MKVAAGSNGLRVVRGLALEACGLGVTGFHRGGVDSA
jgi:hypothetical protein